MPEADGIIIGSPTCFTDVSTEVKALIDRAGCVGLANGSMFSRKVGVAVVAVRRARAVHAHDSTNHLLSISNMITVRSTYGTLTQVMPR